jgi:hypothetical protein
MDFLPESTREPPEEKTLSVYERYPIILSERAEWAKKLNRLPKEGTKEQLRQALLDAFQLIGGTPRIAVEMDEDPLPYLKLLAALEPKKNEHEHTGKVEIVQAIPRSPLDGEYTDVTDCNPVRDEAALPAIPLSDDTICGDGGPSTGGKDSRVRERVDRAGDVFDEEET